MELSFNCLPDPCTTLCPALLLTSERSLISPASGKSGSGEGAGTGPRLAGRTPSPERVTSSLQPEQRRRGRVHGGGGGNRACLGQRGDGCSGAALGPGSAGGASQAGALLGCAPGMSAPGQIPNPSHQRAPSGTGVSQGGRAARFPVPASRRRPAPAAGERLPRAPRGMLGQRLAAGPSPQTPRRPGNLRDTVGPRAEGAEAFLVLLGVLIFFLWVVFFFFLSFLTCEFFFSFEKGKNKSVSLQKRESCLNSMRGRGQGPSYNPRRRRPGKAACRRRYLL